MTSAPSPFTAVAGGLKVRLKVSPKASRDRIGGVECGPEGAALKVAVTAPAEGGKANRAVIALLARAWRLPKSSLELAVGAAARRKALFIAGEAAALIARIRRSLEGVDG